MTIQKNVSSISLTEINNPKLIDVEATIINDQISNF